MKNNNKKKESNCNPKWLYYYKKKRSWIDLDLDTTILKCQNIFDCIVIINVLSQYLWYYIVNQ